MRIFLITDGNGAEMVGLISALRQRGHQVKYWVGLAHGEEKEFPKVIFHNYFDARAGIPPKGIDQLRFPPPGQHLIEQLYGTESLVWSMLKREFARLGMSESRHVYYHLLQYWDGIIREYQPELIIFSIIPHQAYNYLIYQLAKLYSIKTVMFEDTWVSDRTIFYNDFWEGSAVLRSEIGKNRGKNFSLDDLSPDIQEYYKLHTEKDRDATPSYIKRLRQQFSGGHSVIRKLNSFVKTLKHGQTLKIVRQKIAHIFQENLEKEYKKLQTHPDLTKKFIYVPLHYQPERTTSPQGSIFVDQILMLEILSKSLPAGWVIYAKEHPMQWRLHGLGYSPVRYQGYYESIAALRNISLIPLESDTYTLILRSQAVATVSGTAGWEAILRSKPVLIFGYPWYRDCPGLFKVNDVSTCTQALREIKNGFAADPQMVINYLKSLDTATIHCQLDDFEESRSALGKGERISNLAKTIFAELKI